jgi:Zn-dependent peptidase ImmA (M78 family)/transcriptional regulator with XRE-family HTH domain
VASRTLAYVSPEVLRWARDSTGYSLHEAASKIGVWAWQLEFAEEGKDFLTLRQAEKAADFYERPVATLFLPSPPPEEPQEAQFRRLAGAPAPPWSPAMRLLVRRIRARQEAAADLYELLEEEPPWEMGAHQFDVDRALLPRVARDALGITTEHQDRWGESARASQDGYAPLRAWTDAVEEFGVLVMQDGTLSVTQMRGFASMHASVPAIVLNRTDDPRARTFTLLHEFGHLLLAANEVHVEQPEAWCNAFAGDVLMPLDRVAEVFQEADAETLLGRAREVARRFSVTTLAAAVRLRQGRLVSEAEGERLIAEIRRQPHVSERSGGGDYYRNTIGQFGPAFLRLVFSALDNQALTFPTASTLLENVKVNNFEALRDRLIGRAEVV